MKLLLPTQSYSIASVFPSTSNARLCMPGIFYAIPVYTRYGQLVDVNTPFIQSGHRKENFVHHRKPVGQKDVATFISNEVVVTPSGVYQSASRYSSGIAGDSTFWAWLAVPGFTFIVRVSPGNRYLGYARRIDVDYAAVEISPTDSTRFAYFTGRCYRSQSGEITPSTGYESERIYRFIRAILQSLTNWKKGEIGHNNSRSGYEIEISYFRRIMSLFSPHLSTFLSMSLDILKGKKFYKRSGFSKLSLTGLPSPPVTLFNEEYLDEPGILSRQMAQANVLMLMKQRAFYEACDTVPIMNDNNVSNILDLTRFIYDLVVNHKVNIPSSLSDAWLYYRYVYGTTKQDINEAIKFYSRNFDDSLLDVGYKAYGSYTTTIQGVILTSHCKIIMTRREMSKIKEVWTGLKKYGLSPSFYMIWDMIPFSFVVDWFLHIDRIMQVTDASLTYTNEHYDFKNIVYSLTYEIPDSAGVLWKVYTRWQESSPPRLSGFYWFAPESASKGTLIKRAIDALALSIGR